MLVLVVFIEFIIIIVGGSSQGRPPNGRGYGFSCKSRDLPAVESVPGNLYDRVRT